MMLCAVQAHTRRKAAAWWSIWTYEEVFRQGEPRRAHGTPEEEISDKRLLYYIRQMLKAGVIDERGIRHERGEGAPQGGPLSPLLANVLLDDFDKEQERRGHKFCRYADVSIIMVRIIAAAQRVLASVTRYLEGTLKLKVNGEKSKIVSTAQCPYLG